MKLKLIEIINCNTVLNELSSNKSTNIKSVYKIAKMSKALKSELELVEEQRLAIIKKYCAMDENNQPMINNGQYVIPPENTAALQKELNDFLTIEIQMNAEPLTIDDFEGYDVSSKQLTELFVIMGE